jgi:hypothetical protein
LNFRRFALRLFCRIRSARRPHPSKWLFVGGFYFVREERCGEGAAPLFLSEKISTRHRRVDANTFVVCVLHHRADRRRASMEAEAPPSANAPLIRSILRYVVENPDAKDTLDGINEFWLSQARSRYGKREVREALEFLAERKHWLTKSKAGSSDTLYGLDKDCIGEIERFLAETAGQN